jgi:oxygen-independent coproporphyrinogen-3 oxidase
VALLLFSTKNLETYLTESLANAIKAPQHEFSFEGHPNNTTHAHLQSFTIWGLGVSFGVQDKVQKPPFIENNHFTMLLK